jgi:hypothetical protein
MEIFTTETSGKSIHGHFRTFLPINDHWILLICLGRCLDQIVVLMTESRWLDIILGGYVSFGSCCVSPGVRITRSWPLNWPQTTACPYKSSSCRSGVTVVVRRVAVPVGGERSRPTPGIGFAACVSSWGSPESFLPTLSFLVMVAFLFQGCRHSFYCCC